MSGSAIPVVLHVADADISQQLRLYLPGSGFEVADAERICHPYIALIDTDHPQVLTYLGALEAAPDCCGVLLWGTISVPLESRLMVRRLPRPIRLKEIAIQIRRAWQSYHTPSRSVVSGVLYDPRERVLLPSGEGERMMLTAKEALLLEALLDAGEDGLDRAELLRRVWGYAEALETHTLETHLYRLRQKMERLGASPTALRSEQGRFRLSAPADA
jgi:hypothetical protein